MAKYPLPLVDPARLEFGFPRTQCACPECALNCRFIPGYLIPADLDRMHHHLGAGEDLFAWARLHLLASPGAMVLREGQVCRIPTLVPARQPGGACLFLTPGDRCAIHEVAPYGCSHFDCHMATGEADRRSRRGLGAILEAWRHGDLYAQVWTYLDQSGLQAPGPESCRQRLRQVLAEPRGS